MNISEFNKTIKREDIDEISNNLLAITNKDNKKSLFDTNLNQLTDYIFDDIYPVTKDLVLISANNNKDKHGILNDHGDILVPMNYANIKYMYNTETPSLIPYFIMIDNNGLKGISKIDTIYSEVVPCEYTYICSSCIVRKNKVLFIVGKSNYKMMIIYDKNAYKIIKTSDKFKSITILNDNCIKCVAANDKIDLYFIDNNNIDFDNIIVNVGDCMPVNENDAVYNLLLANNDVIYYNYITHNILLRFVKNDYQINVFKPHLENHFNLFSVINNKVKAIFNSNGEKIINLPDDTVYVHFISSRRMFIENKKYMWAIISIDGSLKTDYIYQCMPETLIDGYRYKYNQALIDIDGKVLADGYIEYIPLPKYNYILVGKYERTILYGIIDNFGNKILDCIYDDPSCNNLNLDETTDDEIMPILLKYQNNYYIFINDKLIYVNHDTYEITLDKLSVCPFYSKVNVYYSNDKKYVYFIEAKKMYTYDGYKRLIKSQYADKLYFNKVYYQYIAILAKYTNDIIFSISNTDTINIFEATQGTFNITEA